MNDSRLCNTVIVTVGTTSVQYTIECVLEGKDERTQPLALRQGFAKEQLRVLQAPLGLVGSRAAPQLAVCFPSPIFRPRP